VNFPKCLSREKINIRKYAYHRSICKGVRGDRLKIGRSYRFLQKITSLITFPKLRTCVEERNGITPELAIESTPLQGIKDVSGYWPNLVKREFILVGAWPRYPHSKVVCFSISTFCETARYSEDEDGSFPVLIRRKS
jgi:hypothetical protein